MSPSAMSATIVTSTEADRSGRQRGPLRRASLIFPGGWPKQRRSRPRRISGNIGRIIVDQIEFGGITPRRNDFAYRADHILVQPSTLKVHGIGMLLPKRA